jgi:hypothetical protein
VTEGLGVSALSSSAAHYWNDVIKVQSVLAVAPGTFGVQPFPVVNFREASMMTHIFRKFVDWRRKLRQHLVSVVSPSDLHALRHSGAFFRGLFEDAFRRTALAALFVGLRGQDLLNRFWVMLSAPERVVLTARVDGNADWSSAGASAGVLSFDPSLAPIDLLATDTTRYELTSPFSASRHDDDRNNGVKSENPSSIALIDIEGNPEPSHRCNISNDARAMEGVTTRQ